MFIFSRATALDRHNQMSAVSAAVEVAGMVTKITGMPISVYMSSYGEPTNTVRWSTRIESQAELQAATEKLAANSGYVQWAEKNSHLFETAPSDTLGRVVSASGMEAGPARFVNIITAVAANGRMADAVAFGVRAQQFVAGATKNMSTAFLTGVYGPFGTVTWITGANSMADMDALQEMQATNVGYHELVKDAGDLFVTGSGMTGLMEKIN